MASSSPTKPIKIPKIRSPQPGDDDVAACMLVSSGSSFVRFIQDRE